MRTVAFCTLALVAVSASAAPEPGYVPTNGVPNFVTPSMIKRRGLTDEQYRALWAIGAHPSVDSAVVKELMFHSSRGKNIEEWIGDTMGEPGLGRRVMDTVETNKWLVAENARLEYRHFTDTNRLARLNALYEERGHELATLKEANYLLEQKYAEAKPNAMLAVRVQEALKAEGTLGPYLRNELVQMRDRTEDPGKKEVFESFIALIDSVVNGR